MSNAKTQRSGITRGTTGIGDSQGRGGRIVTEHRAVTLKYREP